MGRGVSKFARNVDPLMWGVGLALSRRIVEGVHKGKIELLETVEGTTFQIRLPVAEA